jgi:predicted SAM-dependent methyltransferase
VSLTLINTGCGAVRPGAPWINVDSLFEALGLGIAQGRTTYHQSLINLGREGNYLDFKLDKVPWPLDTSMAHGILMWHTLEHLDCQEAMRALREARRVLKPEGVIRIGVPDATVFRKNFPADTRANAQALWGEPLPDYVPQETFLDYAMFHEFHKQSFTEDSLWCHLQNSGFRSIRRCLFGNSALPDLASLDNRAPFTLIMEGTK